MIREIINTENAPKAIGPYSQAIKTDSYIFVSGQGAIDPTTNVYTPKTIEEETEISLTNLKNILESAGSKLENVVKITVFLSNMEEFSKFNEVYSKYFNTNPPARSCIEASKLPKGFKVEIEAIALRG